MNDKILPVLDLQVLQQKATEAAMAGAIKSIEEYYSGYNSPYRKGIEDDLASKTVSYHLGLPDIMSLINNALTEEISKIANAAVAKSFLPLVSRILTRTDKEIKFSRILEEFIKAIEITLDDHSYVEVKKDAQFGWLNIKINGGQFEYSLTLHEHHESKKAGIVAYSALMLPNRYSEHSHKQTMKVFLDGATIEMPFTPGVLSDDFTAFIARLVISSIIITMDTEDFNDGMFPQDECHCY